MKEKFDLFNIINKAKIAQRDRSILMLVVCLSILVQSFTSLLLVKQLPDIVERVLEALHVL